VLTIVNNPPLSITIESMRHARVIYIRSDILEVIYKSDITKVIYKSDIHHISYHTVYHTLYHRPISPS